MPAAQTKRLKELANSLELKIQDARAALKPIPHAISPDGEGLYIKNKAGKIVRLSLWDCQKAIIHEVNRSLATGTPCRIILLKPRQSGGSTIFSYITYWLATRLNMSAVIIGHSNTSSQNLRGMVKTFYERDPEYKGGIIRLDRDNDKMMVFPGGGRVLVATAGSKDALTSTTNQVIHATEAALWCNESNEQAGNQMRGLLNTVSDVHMTFVFIESTARPATDYADRWQEATAGRSRYKPIFIPWTSIGQYAVQTLPPSVRKNIIASYDEEEAELVETHGVTPEQMVWRRLTLADKCAGVTKDRKLVDFHTEYPITPEEAFSANESSVFDLVKLNKMMDKAPEHPPLWIGELKLDEAQNWNEVRDNESLRREVLIETRGGRLRIWAWPRSPKEGMEKEKVDYEQYVMGVDVSEGIMTDSEGRDDSAIVLRRQGNGDVVASWAGKMPVDDFATAVISLGLLYNVAYICPEANNMGIVVGRALWKHYPRVAIYLSKRGLDDEEAGRVGFLTTHQSKNPAIYELSTELKNGEFKCWDVDLIRQMQEARHDVTGKIATGGRDKMMAAVMSSIARRDQMEYVTAPEEEVEQTPYEIYTAMLQKRKDQAAFQQVWGALTGPH